MMKIALLVILVITTISVTDNVKNCFQAATDFKNDYVKALENGDLELIIDDLERVFETYPSLLETCGANKEAKQVKQTFPPTCSKVLSKQAKILVKLLRLYAHDKEKNQKAIIMYSAMFETTYKTKVQKKCPLFEKQEMKEVKNKGQCAEGMYRLSLIFEQLDNDLMAGKFNNSLTDMGKVVQKLPDTLDSCSQHAMAQLIRTNFPEQCLGAIGALVRELATLEHNYTHLEWLRKHLKDFTSALLTVKAACPALEH